MSFLDGLTKKVVDLRFPWERESITPPVPGLYHYLREDQAEKSRIHLRIDGDGSAVLIINASRILHLNPTAALVAYSYLEGRSAEAAVRELQALYRVSGRQAGNDYQTCIAQLHELLRPDGACPIHELDLETRMPFSHTPSAPYRMDLALTYACNNDCVHCYNVKKRSARELSCEEWKQIIDRCWDLTIPHIIFTGGEPTLYRDLPTLVRHAELNGQITGLNTNGRRLGDPIYLGRLLDAGLDHVQVTLESHRADVHDEIVSHPGAWKETAAGIQAALASRLYVMTNTTLLDTNSQHIGETIQFLADIGVRTVGINSLIYSGRGKGCERGLKESELPRLLNEALQITTRNQQRLIWYTPTQYCQFDPVAQELGVKGCTAALYNMCIEPDGRVIPCQSYYQPLGSMLIDDWSTIWNHPLSTKLRNRHGLPDKCVSCELVSECGGGCPLQFEDHSMPVEMMK